jgi:O-antigen/teichoic acid export membrane protein
MSTSTERVTAEPAAHEAEEKGPSTLFGRGLLYVVVWSLQLVASSVISPVLAHLMPQAQFGSFATAIALYQAMSALAAFGLDQAIVLQHAEDGNPRRARGLVAVAMVLAAAVTVIGLLTMSLWANAAGFSGETALVTATMLWVGPGAVVQVVLALLVAQDRFRVFTAISLITAIGGSAFGLVLILTVKDNAFTYALGGVASAWVAMAISLCVAAPRLRGLFDWATTRRALALGVPVAVGNLAYFVLNAGDRFVVQSELGSSEVARYQVAYVIGSAVILLLTFTNQAWAPQFAAVRDTVARRVLALHSRDMLYRLLAPLLLAVTLVSPIALPILAPASYHPDTLLPVVFVVALTAFPVVAAGATGRLLVVERRGVIVGVIALAGAAANVIANLLLVPVMGILGAAVATVISYALLAGLQILALTDRAEWRGPRVGILLEVVPAMAIAAGSLFVPQNTEWNIVRCIAVLICIPWFFMRLRSARATAVPDSHRPHGAHGAHLGVVEPAPRRVVHVDLDAPLPELVADETSSIAMVVGFRGKTPVGTVDVLLTTDPADAQRQLDVLASVVPEPYVPVPDDQLPPISVIVSTLASRLEDLNTQLDRLTDLDYPRYEVILVDNRVTVPPDDALPALVAGRGVRLVVERRRGLSAGRNAGVAAARTEIIAFTDDDVRVDERWLRAIGERYVREPELDAVTGLVLPTELETPAQIWFEAYYGGMNGERRFEGLTISPDGRILGRSHRIAARDRHGALVRRFPVYGVGGYGVGASMSIRKSAIERVGGFDNALGAGSPSKGGEDLQMLIEVLWRGGSLGFEPRSVVHHRHRRLLEELEEQMYGNGVGLSALFSSLIRRDPRHLVVMAAQAPISATTKLKQMLSRLGGRGGAEALSIATAVAAPTPPASLAAHEIRGFRHGMSAYRRSRRQWRQVLRSER